MSPLPNAPGLLSPRLRPMVLAVSLWLFGISTSVLLVGSWGRAVSEDEATLSESARVVLESDLVHDRLTGWLSDGLTATLSMTPEEVAGLVEMVVESDEMDTATGLLVDHTVAAALAPPGSGASVDLSDAVDALGPALTRALTDAGIAVEPDALAVAVSETDLVLTADERLAISGRAHRAGGMLTNVLVLGLVGMTTTGTVATVLSDDRRARVRSLAWRIALSSATFAMMLRIGAWAIDPSGGRSPIAGGAAVLAGSNLEVPLGVMVLAACVGVALGRRRLHRNREGHPALVLEHSG